MRPLLSSMSPTINQDRTYDHSLLEYKRPPHRFLARRRCGGMSFWDIRRELKELVDERADVEQVGARVGDADHGDAPSPGELDRPGLWINPALVYPPFDATVFTRAPTSDGFYVKRPDFLVYEMPSRRAQIAPRLGAEARVFEQLREHPPHPTIVRYHGVLVVDDFIQGLVLDKLGDNLYGRVKATAAPPLDVTKVVRGVSDALKFFIVPLAIAIPTSLRRILRSKAVAATQRCFLTLTRPSGSATQSTGATFPVGGMAVRQAARKMTGRA